MIKVSGIGGIFFRAKNPEKLAKWYRDSLGVDLAPTDATMQPWISDQGVTVFAPFAEDTDYFPKDRSFMLNFRVEDLDAMLAQLRDNDIESSHEQVMERVGRFARIHDPEGNPVELWEPVQP